LHDYIDIAHNSNPSSSKFDVSDKGSFPKVLLLFDDAFNNPSSTHNENPFSPPPSAYNMRLYLPTNQTGSLL
jgi:hypothetical protein